MDWQDRLLKILLADTNSLKELALLAGGDPKSFYRTADFTSVDIGKLDARGVKLPELEHWDIGGAKTTRLLIKINPLVHLVIKNGNVGALSAHINVLLRTFLDDHFPMLMSHKKLDSRRLENELLAKMLDNFRFSEPPPIFDRKTVSYHVEESLKERISLEARRIGQTQTEFARVAIYYTLLNDSVRGYEIYQRRIVEGSLVNVLKEYLQRGTLDRIVINNLKEKKKTSLDLRQSLEGFRSVQVHRQLLE